MTATTIRLTGQLGQRFGREHRFHLDTKTPAEAIRALCSAIAGFREYLANAKTKGVEFAIWRGKGVHAENIGTKQLNEPAGGAIRIASVFAGAKNGGLLQTITGAALIVVGGFISDWSFGVGAPFGTALAQVGLSMMLGGVVQMLSPQPKLQKNADSSGNQASYVFSGAVNTTAQGNPVPILYGRMIVGSAVVSAGIEADEYSAATDGVGTGTVNGSQLASPYQMTT